MTLILKQIFGFLKLLNSDTGTNQLAAGIAAGFILGMGPALSLQTLLVFLTILLFRIQLGAALLSSFFFAFTAWVFDPFFHSIGMKILESKGLAGIFTTLYNLPLIPFTKFNNSIVMGSGVVAFVAAPFIYMLAKGLITKYRTLIVEKFKQTKFWKAVKATSLFKWYYKYDNLYQ